MSPVAPLVRKLIIDSLLAPRTTKAKKDVTGMVLYIFAGSFILLTLLCLTMAANSYLATEFNPVEAALLTAAGTFVLAMITGVTGYLVVSRKQRAVRAKAAGPLGDLAQSVEGMFESVMGDLDQPIKSNPLTSVVIASVLGYLAADKLS